LRSRVAMTRVVVQRPAPFYRVGLGGGDSSTRHATDMLAPLRATAASLVGLDLVEVATREAALAALPGADGFVGSGGDVEAVLAAAGGSLRWLQVQSAGVDGYPLELLERAGVTLTNAAVVYGPQLADHQMSLILAFSRQLPFLLGAQRDQRWASRDEFPPGELAGQTLLVVGLGGAGLETARRAHGFGMRVIGEPGGIYPRADCLGWLTGSLDHRPQTEADALTAS
jgi:phosphoglycerate dehydrogenase-like enzyme